MFDMWALQIEANSVIAMRMARFARGDADAQRESERMVTEKMMLQWELAMKAAAGSLGATPQAAASAVIRRTRTKVRANQRRLSRR